MGAGGAVGLMFLIIFTDELWGQFKPDRPRTSCSTRGFDEPPKTKKVKYDPPPKLPTSIYALPSSPPPLESDRTSL